MKLLIDTNVILDIILQREPFFENSYFVLSQSLEEDTELYFSASPATDIFYIVRKAVGKEAAKEAIDKIMHLFVCEDTKKLDILNALESNMSDFEDSVIDSIAARISADYIITRNVKDYLNSSITAISPTDYLNLKNNKKENSPS